MSGLYILATLLKTNDAILPHRTKIDGYFAFRVWWSVSRYNFIHTTKNLREFLRLFVVCGSVLCDAFLLISFHSIRMLCSYLTSKRVDFYFMQNIFHYTEALIWCVDKQHIIFLINSASFEVFVNLTTKLDVTIFQTSICKRCSLAIDIDSVTPYNPRFHSSVVVNMIALQWLHYNQLNFT